MPNCCLTRPWSSMLRILKKLLPEGKWNKVLHVTMLKVKEHFQPKQPVGQPVGHTAPPKIDLLVNLDNR